MPASELSADWGAQRIKGMSFRAALRSAWTADRAIRDFVGIADNQWDFNEPAGIPGFGALGPGDYAPSLAARALGSLQEGGAAPDLPEAAQHPAVPRIDPQRTEPDEVRQVAATPAQDDHGADLTGQIVAGQVVEAGVQRVPPAEEVSAVNPGPRRAPARRSPTEVVHWR